MDVAAQVLNYVAWVASALIFLWMIVDAVRVETTYDRKLLVSSVEGEIEKEILGHEELAHQIGRTEGS
jgi:hypothetical protein